MNEKFERWLEANKNKMELLRTIIGIVLLVLQIYYIFFYNK